jgi:hypothetical protein
MQRDRVRPWWAKPSLVAALAGGVIGTAAGVTIRVATGYVSLWSGVLLDLVAMLGVAALMDVARRR